MTRVEHKIDVEGDAKPFRLVRYIAGIMMLEKGNAKVQKMSEERVSSPMPSNDREALGALAAKNDLVLHFCVD